jgi:hypothetical protein
LQNFKRGERLVGCFECNRWCWRGSFPFGLGITLPNQLMLGTQPLKAEFVR